MQNNLQSEKIIKDIRTLLGEKWNEKIFSFLSSREMVGIVEQLIELKQSGKFFVPSLKDAFNPYKKVPPHKVNVVIITSLKTSIPELTTGNSFPMQPNSVPMKMVLETISKKDKTNQNSWHEYGVLQMSTAMTSTLYGSHHYDIWKPWVTYMINKINDIAPDAPVILIGKGAVRYRLMLKSKNVFVVKTWPEIDANDCWLKVNDILLDQNKKPVKWADEAHNIRVKEKAIRREIANIQYYSAKKKERESKSN